MKTQKEIELKEEGVWIVYDLEANRKIQNLLTKEGFSFRFDPNFERIKQEYKQTVEKMIEKCKIHTAGALILIEKKEIKSIIGSGEK